jgi:hypothetical protein
MRSDKEIIEELRQQLARRNETIRGLRAQLDRQAEQLPRERDIFDEMYEDRRR